MREDAPELKSGETRADGAASAGRGVTSRTSEHSREDEMNVDAAGAAAVSSARPQAIGKEKQTLPAKSFVGARVTSHAGAREQEISTVVQKFQASSSKPTRHQNKSTTASLADCAGESRAKEAHTARLASTTTAMAAPQHNKYALAPHDDVCFRKGSDQDSFEEPIGHGLFCAEDVCSSCVCSVCRVMCVRI